MSTAALIGSIVSILGLVAKILADAKGLLPNKPSKPSDPPQ